MGFSSDTHPVSTTGISVRNPQYMQVLFFVSLIMHPHFLTISYDSIR